MKYLKSLTTLCIALLVFTACSKKDDSLGEDDPCLNGGCTNTIFEPVMIKDALAREILNEVNRLRANPSEYKFIDDDLVLMDVKETLSSTAPQKPLKLSEELTVKEHHYIRVICYEYKWGSNCNGSSPKQRAIDGGMKNVNEITELQHRTATPEMSPYIKDRKKLAKEVVNSFVNYSFGSKEDYIKLLLDSKWKYAGVGYASRVCKAKYYYGIVLAN
ncbi:hypothetical protein K4L44_13600 [Halosquirtibacter laminarini]|uniref:Uncharacterized protein n=1 Tax=Halosquirtibacter laminarini TaxID=3374600 RepID=A0AC61NDG1_9BACT|nr:hypothetical protein K4L44_13600 [Prolixibacteraceae bacterium]